MYGTGCAYEKNPFKIRKPAHVFVNISARLLFRRSLTDQQNQPNLVQRWRQP